MTRWSAFVCLAALAGVSCGHAGSFSAGPSENRTLQLDDSSNEIVLTNNTGRVMLTGSSFLLEERTDSGWESADRTLERISVQPQAARLNPLRLTHLAPGAKSRYPISYVDQLPPGEYRVTVGTGKDDKHQQIRASAQPAIQAIAAIVPILLAPSPGAAWAGRACGAEVPI